MILVFKRSILPLMKQGLLKYQIAQVLTASRWKYSLRALETCCSSFSIRNQEINLRNYVLFILHSTNLLCSIFVLMQVRPEAFRALLRYIYTGKKISLYILCFLNNTLPFPLLSPRFPSFPLLSPPFPSFPSSPHLHFLPLLLRGV